MEKLRARFRIHFSTKVIVPVVAVMVLLLAITVWLVNHRITQQFRFDAAQSLAHANAVFRNSQKNRAKNLLLRYGNLPNEPRCQATFQAAHGPTTKALLTELLNDNHLDAVLFTTDKEEAPICAHHDPLISVSEFQSASERGVRQAIQGEAKSDIIRVGEKLLEVVSIPVKGTGDYPIGALTLAEEVGEATAQEFKLLTQNEIVLLANARVIASTVPRPEFYNQFVLLFNGYLTDAHGVHPTANVEGIILGENHYYYSAGTFESLSSDGKLGYLLLSSYEQPLRALHSTQQMLLGVSTMAILSGALIVWLVVRKVTQPLRALRDSAEAVGKGDFSQRVEVTSLDECGELAAVFNQMTENVKRSREQLETTVETLKNTQAQLIQSEKLSGIGEFVAGVAHELNNPLTSVMGFSELLERVDKDPQHKRYLEMICKSAQRCHKIVQSLLSFARRRQPERKLSSLNELIESAIDFLQYQLRTSNIEVINQLAPDLPKTMVDPHQVQQVFLNIINNARQAIEAHQPRGWIRITSQVCGNNVRVVLEDNGPGISESNLSKVFDPFFTTKEVGKGTGLGLSLCYGIVKEHGGTIEVRSKPGEGATFVIELPITGADETPRDNAALPMTSPSNANPLEGAGRKLLVIDDEEQILHMVRDMLTEQGYEVDVARDGESALRCLSQTRYDLALCDWKMPGLNGQQVYEKAREANPALSEKFVFFTGDVINEKAQQFLKERHQVCLSKPFSLNEFRSAIGKALATV